MNKLLAQIDFGKFKIPNNAGADLKIDNNLSLGAILTKVFQVYIFYVAGMILLIYLIVGGLQFMLSRGDPKATQAARTRITNAVVGFAIVFLAFTIVQVFALIFGLDKTLFGTVLGL